MDVGGMNLKSKTTKQQGEFARSLGSQPGRYDMLFCWLQFCILESPRVCVVVGFVLWLIDFVHSVDNYEDMICE